jgi:hypothetical protein
MSESRIIGLESLLKEAASRPGAPVERWDPPYCGDIGLAIAADGTWLYRGSAIRRPALVKVFARVLRRDPDGRHYLVTPAEKVDVVVADAPYLAVEMEVRQDGGVQQIVFRTNVDDIVTVGAGHPLRFTTDPVTGGLKPYLLVRGRLEALVTRALTMDLVALAEEDSAGRLGVGSGGVWFGMGE